MIIKEAFQVVISGGHIEEACALPYLQSPLLKRIIAADRGMEFLYRHHIRPDVIVGDFDSCNQQVLAYYRQQPDVEIREFDAVKDFTDTEVGLRTALECGHEPIILLGATGTRLDHVWGNVQSLSLSLSMQVPTYMVDAHNCIRLLDTSVTLDPQEAFGTYFSLFPLGADITDLTIKGARYPLQHHHLSSKSSLSVSNQYTDDLLHIIFTEGILVLIESRD